MAHPSRLAKRCNRIAPLAPQDDVCAKTRVSNALPPLERCLAPFLYRELRLLGVFALLDFMELSLRATGLFGWALRQHAVGDEAL